MIEVIFACGDRRQMSETADQEPACPFCGERRVESVRARDPRIVGTARGPLVEKRALEAIPVSLATTLLPPFKSQD